MVTGKIASTRRHVLSIFLTLCMVLITAIATAAEPLSLLRGFQIEGIDDLQPSGLAACHQKLLAVSDRHDSVIFELIIDDKRALARPFLVLTDIPRFDLPAEFPWWKKLVYRAFLLIDHAVYDWEGITCLPDGAIYLASESTTGILEVLPDGSKQWLSTNLYPAARHEGMLAKDNAYVEGIAHDGKSLVVAMERELRGIAILKGTENSYSADGLYKPETPQKLLPTIGARVDDFADIVAFDGALLTLERNRSGVCRRNRQTMAVEACWSYSDVENDPAYLYQDATYGLGEGLAILNGRIYVAFDNNGQAHAADAKNTTPWLFEFKLPNIDLVK